MLGVFTGDTRRRKMNLGTRSRTTKDDLIKKAQQERERRACDRAFENAARRIQREIKKYLACRTLFCKDVIKMTTNQYSRLIPAYGNKLLQYQDKDTFRMLLKKSRDYINDVAPADLVATRVVNLLTSYEDDSLFVPTVGLLDSCHLSSFNTVITNGLLPFLNNTKDLSSESIDKICQILLDWDQTSHFNGNETLDLTRIYELPTREMQKSSMTDLYTKLFQRNLRPSLYVEKESNIVNIFDNLCRIFHFHMATSGERMTVIPYLLAYVPDIKKIRLNDNVSDADSDTDMDADHTTDNEKSNDIIDIFSKVVSNPHFLDALMNQFLSSLSPLVKKEDMYLVLEKIKRVIQICDKNYLKYTVLLNLLSKGNDTKMLINNLFYEDDDSSLYLMIEFINMHMITTTDYDLLSNNNDVITIRMLFDFTKFLKLSVFNDMWNNQHPKRSDCFQIGLDLLNKIYLRDSRTGFVTKLWDAWYEKKTGRRPTGKDSFWCVGVDEKFMHLKIFEEFYRFSEFYTMGYERIEIGELNTYHYEGIKDIPSLKMKLISKRHQGQINLDRFQTAGDRKLEILLLAPYFVPFEERIEYFHFIIEKEKGKLQALADQTPSPGPYQLQYPFLLNRPQFGDEARTSSSGSGRYSGRRRGTISRDSILEDAYNSFGDIGEGMKMKLDVTFVNEFGPEAGIDGGGITKEMLTCVTDEGFKDPEKELFQTTGTYKLYPMIAKNGITREKGKYFEFMGAILGKCLYDHVLIDVQFANFFLQKLLNCSNNFLVGFDDLVDLDPVLYRNLLKLVSMSATELKELDLNFEITSATGDGTVELIPNGANVKVSKENVLLYLTKVSDYKLNISIAIQTQRFHDGLMSIIKPLWMELFNARELQMLISGAGKDIDLKNLKENTVYGGYVETDLTIRYFWEILEEFTTEQRFEFVKFVTSVPQAPLRGFQTLEPLFGIRNAGSGDLGRLPTASTCVNLLKLPDYQNKTILKEKLLYAIEAGAGFDLS
ncbi:ubiquitin-ubiquitin ligase HUL5 NDAI_0H03280 [Naumovozyma dairenensis CBS 421]|uniref:HECT-type E3 ubiquitin transferase n=1 Tax=Naumovozyma dairenensis (strain ATCC 10597 / BCRC 20456 / CBS 421 / NBRC 0211 / NRRL Y-12639) TaxID=1071378 RepID=G0WFE0_NAUDC|nr:hypothetical protein NDAI_0H03280 [Naumovozyma dairenensis CBS 421]CCD26501.1 hypothetical protein NDAI_0H03280 [Naumovozyma dairenensis CBS 421]